jgi:hypothetical protein
METVLSHWLTWLIALGVTLVIMWLCHRAENRELEAKLRQFEKMAEHGSPALGLMPLVLAPGGGPLLEVILPLLALASGLGFIGTLLFRLGLIS